MADTKEFTFDIVHDYGAVGEGSWKKHLTLLSWNGGAPKYDLRVWNEDMTRNSKSATLTKKEMEELIPLFKEILEK